MNKGAIQKFAIWARKELITQVSQRAYQYGIDESGFGDASADTLNGRLLTAEEKSQRQELIKQIKEKGYKQVMEEVAYTWFNRFIALRFMEVNNYLPSHIRVFSDSTGAFKPEILSDVLHLDLPGLNRGKVAEYIESNDTEGLYRYLLLTQCNALNDPLPRMFEEMGGYTELLLPNNILKQDSVLGHMVSDIPEGDWQDAVQIIGWLYQYYNTELKDDTFALLKKNVKITKERIPSATQLFTPDWIVRYMVENSLGRLYVDKRKNEGIYADGRGLDEMTWHEAESERIATEKLIADKMGWKYYLPEAEQTQDVRKQLDEIQAEYANLDVKDIKVIDPCMGSGHILAYAFDVLMQIYEATGYSQRDAAQSILENNLFGLDIDDRAAQLAYFAVMMKARQYDRRIFSRGIQPHVYAIVESNGLDNSSVEYFTNNDPQLKKDFGTLMVELRDAKEYGSILNISQVDFASLYARVEKVWADISMFRESVLNSFLPLIQVAEIMAQKYDVVVTNPPYMGSSGMGSLLNGYLKENYPVSKGDLFAVFIERCLTMTRTYRYSALITQQSWMFLSSYEKLREKLTHTDVATILHLGAHAFEELGGEVVQTVAFILRKSNVEEYASTCDRLASIENAGMKEESFLGGKYRMVSRKSDYDLIPAKPYAYWISPKALENFKSKNLGSYAEIVSGMTTGNNDVFLKAWTEVDVTKIAFGKTDVSQINLSKTKWIPYHKGGEMRKWYGNHEFVVNWSRSGEFNRAKTTMTHVYLKPCITWSDISGNSFAGRYCFGGFMFDVKGSCAFAPEDRLRFLIGIFNSKVTPVYIEALNPTTTTQVGDLKRIPLIIPDTSSLNQISTTVEECIEISKSEWDSFEFSWDFVRHPLVSNQQYSSKYHPKESFSPEHYLADAYQMWAVTSERRFQQLQANEEKLNHIFIDIYGLHDELTPKVEDGEVTVRKADLGRDIRSFISYAVGCMFGRYSLDVDGLAYAGGEWDESRYKTIVPDSDNIIPICDDDYFDDDITGRFVKWVETVYGSETLEENLKFVADALGGKGTPREVIRSYFLNDFYADHLKTYQKRPIYWLFDSGKKNGFKALCYMHRYQSDLLARMRTDYVHEQQERYRTQLAHLADAIDHAGAAERVKLTKQQKKIQEQALEIQKYEEKIHHLADQNIRIDLDDGVKHNYELFADVLAKIK